MVRLVESQNFRVLELRERVSKGTVKIVGRDMLPLLEEEYLSVKVARLGEVIG